MTGPRMRYVAFVVTALATIASARADVAKLPVLGGAGGEHFEYQCADNGYLVGVRAYVGDWIDNVQAVCAKYDPVTGRMSAKAAEGPIFGGAAGKSNTSGNGRTFSPCVRDQLIYSVDVVETKNESVLGRIRLACLFSTTLKRPTSSESPNVIELAGRNDFKGRGLGSSVKYAVCPAGLVAVGIRGRSGLYLDAFGLICGPTGRATSRSEAFTVVLVSADGKHATYSEPSIRATNGETVRLDWCREWGANCGRPVAEAYCKAKGFAFVDKFSSAGITKRTGIISTGEICAGDLCTGFREISCSKTNELEAEASQGSSPFGSRKKPDRGDVSDRAGAGVVLSKPNVDIDARPAGDLFSQPNNPGAPSVPARCKPGFVWRVARADDRVCVTPAARTRIARENVEGPSHVDPSGAYGSNTCVSGYVWRNAFEGDVVCVTPKDRDRAARQNRLGPDRRAGN